MFSRDDRGAACLGIARGAVTVAGQAGAMQQAEVFDLPAKASERAAGPAATDTAQGLPGAVRRAWGTGARAPGARVVVGNDVARHWLVAPPMGATSLGEIQAVAQARFAALFAERPDEWRMTGDWRVGRPFLCAAVPRWVTAGVGAAPSGATPAGLTGTVLGQALALFHRHVPNAGWCCIASPRSLTLMHLHEGLPVTLRILPVADGATRDAVLATGAQALQREAARQASSPVAQATWLDLTPGKPSDDHPPSSEHSGVTFRRLRLNHAHPVAGSTVGAAGEATVAALLGRGLGVSVS